MAVAASLEQNAMAHSFNFVSTIYNFLLQSNTPWYDGRNLVRDNEDVLLVSFNYRLNIFGQPNAPHLASKTQSQNFGMLDVQAAVKWVHANIVEFGGDPQRIIFTGHSAAGAAVNAYTYSHPHNTFVKRD